ncbi:MAG: ImmA/IrrE family metallo-endopeptidase, partial [Actinomycetota bacterium]|nr:ImmA/IrrE family metallo-endopeptidase [Actinomycetota bacterium]
MGLCLDGRWFVESQTTARTTAYNFGRDTRWCTAQALARLGIIRLAFSPVGAEITGYSFKRFLAVDTSAAHPEKTLFHELAHIRLGHSEQIERRSRAGRLDGPEEIMAEAVAMLLAGALSMPGSIESGALLRPAFARCGLTEPDAARVFKVADEILAAGRENTITWPVHGRRKSPRR